MSDEQIIAIRKATRSITTTPWSDTLAFAKALIEAYENNKKGEEQ